jgi:hypothetical protein
MTVSDVLTKTGKSGNFEVPKKIYAQAKGRNEFTFCNLSK